MKLESVRVQNFKGVKDVSIGLTDVTLLVGANNSGKSSFLQAIHFASRSIAQASEANKQSTKSLRELEYVPSQLYWELAHNDRWGNRSDQPESRVSFSLSQPENPDAPELKAEVSLKSARNEGIAVNPRLDSNLLSLFRNKNSVFSAYIPGLAGIPLEETFLSKRNVYRKAASGDSNIVLRNILFLLKSREELENTIECIRELYQDRSINIDVSFSNNDDYFFRSSLKTKLMTYEKPLELSGTGMLQVLQIFAYLYLFRPKIILIDEPEAHLHPPLQTRLIGVLQKAVKQTGSTALITTHSPFVASGLAEGATTVWLEGGLLAATTASRAIRDALGWGALDKKVIICAEDRDISLLEMILHQDAEVSRDVAVVPFSGVSKMGTASALSAFRDALGKKHRVMVYRDRDCMTDEELDKWFVDYDNHGFGRLVPDGVEIENCFADPANIASRLGISYDDAISLMQKCVQANQEELKGKFRTKRQDIISKYYRDGGSPATDDLWATLKVHERLAGKVLVKKLNKEIEEAGMPRRDLLRTSEDISIGISLVQQVRNFLRN